jgi:hypothetical protein
MKTGKFLLVILTFLTGCSQPEDDRFNIFSESYDFTLSPWGWEAGYTGYPVSETPEGDTIYNFETDYTDSPFSEGDGMALRLTCNNESGEIFMYVKKKVSGLHPNTTYSIVYSIGVLSEAVLGDGVMLKAGASFVEPQKVIHDGHYELNLDKGDYQESGGNLVLLGELGGPFDGAGYLYNSFSNASAPRRFTAKTNNIGELWLIVGTESRVPGINTVYYSEVQVIFSASS